MQGDITLFVLGSEEFTGDVTGFGNFAAYLDLSPLVSGDVLVINQYLHVTGMGGSDPRLMNSASISFDDLQTAGEEGAFAIPFALENEQIGRIGVELTSGTTGVSIPWRITNLQTGD